MTLRNVPKAHTLEQQRQEINLIASDLNTAVDGTQTFGGSKEFSSDVTFNGVTEFTGSTNLISGSNKLNFNTNTNQEGQLWANSDNFYINSSATNGMLIQANSIALRSATGGENYFTASINAGARLYHNDVQKFETTATGVNISGNIDDVTDISCNSIINNAGGVPTFSIFNTGNALFEDVEATSLHMKDDRPAYFGTNEDASLYYDNTSSDLRLDSEVGFHVRWYDSANTQYEDQAVFSPFGSTSFYYQGAATPTLSIDDGVDVRGVLTVGSNTVAGDVRIGLESSNYLKIFGSSGETYIRNRDNDIGGTATTINIQGRTGVALWQDTGNLGLQVDSNCAVKLYYSTSEKLKTTTDGVEITGTLDVSDTLDVVGNTTIGAPDVTNASTGGVQAFASGQLRIQRDGSGAATDKRFQMYYGTSETASITAGGDATFAGDLTLTDSTKELTAQKIKPVDAATTLTIGGAGLGFIAMESDVVVFDQIGFMAFGSAGLNLGPYGTGALSTGGTNGIFKKYEEGTWTPAVQGLTTTSIASGHYTRVGNLVYVVGYVDLNNSKTYDTGFSGTNSFKIEGLPFAEGAISNAWSGVTIGNARYIDFTNRNQFTGNIGAGQQVLTFRWIGNNANFTDVTLGDLYSNFSMHFSCVYTA